jgi:hypothetical protein
MEHLDVFDQPMTRVQQQNREDLMLEACELDPQILLDDLWRTELVPRCIFRAMAQRGVSRTCSTDTGR